VPHEVRIVTTPGTPTAVVGQATTWAEFPALWSKLLDEVWAFVRGTELAPERNVMLYKDDVPNVEVGGSFEPHGSVVPSALPAGQAAHAISRGPPSREGLNAAHEAVLSWCTANDVKLSGVRWEVYDHWRDDDPDGFETEIYWLLSSTRSSGS
jgi:effector-binding domain-containing protein